MGGMNLDSLRARVQRGEISQDSMRALVGAMRARAGAQAGGQAAGQAGGMAFMFGGQRGATAPRGAPRPAIVFVVDELGQPTPRLVQIGLNDWDSTQIVSGLEVGEKVAVIGAAQLQARQSEMIGQMRSRMGGGGGAIIIGR